MPTGPRKTELAVRTLATALHSAGLPAHRTEDETRRVATALGRPVQVFATPTAVFLAFDGGPVELVRARPAEIDLGRLNAIDDALRVLDVDPGALTEDTDTTLARLTEPSEPRPAVATVLSYGAIAAAATLAMRGPWLEAAWAVVCGCLVGVLAAVVERQHEVSRRVAPLFVALAAVIATIAAFLVFDLVDSGVPLSPQRLTVASLIALVPGLSLTTAISELAQGHLASGSSRVAGSVLTLLQMAVGVALGAAIASVDLGEHAPAVSVDTNLVRTSLAVVLGALALMVQFRAPATDLGRMMLAGTVALGGAYVGGLTGGPTAGAFVGALAVGLTAHIHARWRKRPALTIVLPGIILLVPGSIGLLSVQAFLADDATGGTEAAFRMLVTASALVAGLLFAHLLLPPRRTL